MSIFDTVRLGRTPLRTDPRTIAYRAIAPSPWTPPASYDFDAEHPTGAFPARMYLNDTYGDCVIAAQANHLARMEYDETGTARFVSDAEVKAEYFTQTGGPDVGLDPISSLNKWRRGWFAGGKVHNIHAWARLPAQDEQQVMEAAIVGQGLQVGLRLPISAAHQIDRGEMWDVVAGQEGQADSWGGHMVYLKGYDAHAVRLWTWGKVQEASWRWLAEYSDFCALAVDDITKVGDDLDVVELGGLLKEIDS